MIYSTKMIRTLLLSGLFLVAGSAAPVAMAGEAHDLSGDPGRGAASWSQICGRCHNLRPPEEFRDDLWRAIVTHMRVRGGLTGRQQRDILAFLQASNNPSPAVVPVALGTTSAGPALSGQEVYAQTCIACHGGDGKGALPGTPDFTSPSGPLAQADTVLLTHITEGFQTPGNAMAMPAKGGNTALTPAEISAVLAYLRSSFGN